MQTKPGMQAGNEQKMFRNNTRWHSPGLQYIRTLPESTKQGKAAAINPLFTLTSLASRHWPLAPPPPRLTHTEGSVQLLGTHCEIKQECEVSLVPNNLLSLTFLTSSH